MFNDELFLRPTLWDFHCTFRTLPIDLRVFVVSTSQSTQYTPSLITCLSTVRTLDNTSSTIMNVYQESLIRLVIPLTLTQTCVKYRFMVIYQLKLQFNFTKIHETLSIYAKSDICIIINNIIILLYYLFRLSQSCRRSFSMLKTMSFKL